MMHQPPQSYLQLPQILQAYDPKGPFGYAIKLYVEYAGEDNAGYEDIMKKISALSDNDPDKKNRRSYLGSTFG